MPECCGDVRGAECHCGKCHQTFGNLKAFDAHQDVGYRRKRSEDRVKCRPPIGLGLVQDARGTWHTPEGLKARESYRARLAEARTERYQARAKSALHYEAHGGRKLVPSQVAEIKTELRDGATAPSLASRYGVSDGLIYAIKYGRTWADVGGDATCL